MVDANVSRLEEEKKKKKRNQVRNQVGMDVYKFFLSSFGKIGKITQIFCSNS